MGFDDHEAVFQNRLLAYKAVSSSIEVKSEKPQPLSNEQGSSPKAGGKRSNICGKRRSNKLKTRFISLAYHPKSLWTCVRQIHKEE